MIFSILVLGAPTSSQSHNSALRFCRAALQSNHSIYRVFFYDEATTIGNALSTPATDAPQHASEWQQLAIDYNLDLVICVASALKRGVINDTEAKRLELGAGNLLPQFEISGLGQMIDATAHSDRVITFGG